MKYFMKAFNINVDEIDTLCLIKMCAKHGQLGVLKYVHVTFPVCDWEALLFNFYTLALKRGHHDTAQYIRDNVCSQPTPEARYEEYCRHVSLRE